MNRINPKSNTSPISGFQIIFIMHHLNIYTRANYTRPTSNKFYDVYICAIHLYRKRIHFRIRISLLSSCRTTFTKKIVKDAHAHTRKKAFLFACHFCDDTSAYKHTNFTYYIKRVAEKIEPDRRPIFAMSTRENSAEKSARSNPPSVWIDRSFPRERFETCTVCACITNASKFVSLW